MAKERANEVKLHLHFASLLSCFAPYSRTRLMWTYINFAQVKLENVFFAQG